MIVIDTPPHADAAAREAIKACDLVLIPTRPQPGPLSLKALDAGIKKMSDGPEKEASLKRMADVREIEGIRRLIFKEIRNKKKAKAESGA